MTGSDLDLARALRHIHGLEDLPPLLARLGFEPRWGDLDPTVLAPPRRANVSAAAELAHRGDFQWLGLIAQDAPLAAGTTADRLLRRARSAGILALDPTTRHLAISVAFGATPVLHIALDAPDPVALDALTRLRHAEGNPLALAARIAETLAAEGVGRRFFQEFRRVHARLADALPAAANTEERHALAMLQLTRVLFLYFVQSKGWLDGRTDFLARHIDHTLSHGRHLHRDLLRPLFFGSLDRLPATRSRATRTLGQLPFLNGGLFEIHPLERRWPADLPNEIWRDAFDTLFERFRFTITPAPSHGTVAPDMLGRVFEGVMEPATRRASGTFYTPPALVRALLHEAAAALAARRLGIADNEAARLLRDRAPAIATALADATVLDPAAGSGAFLLGALDFFTDLATAQGTPRATAKRDVLHRRLFGVDLSATAVRLAELRLWLATIADDDAATPESVQPLPNLDCIVRQGDSLTDPLGAPPGAPAPSARLLGPLRQAAVSATGPTKRAAMTALRRGEVAACVAHLETLESRVAAEIRECLAHARTPTLFEPRRGLDSAHRARLHRLRTQLHDLRSQRRRVTRDGEVPWFHYQSHFADIFAQGGFDLVVGNPPWVRAAELPATMRQRLAERFRWWRSATASPARAAREWGAPPPARGYAHRPDLAVAFAERAFELVAPHGVVALLVPAKLAGATWGATARHALAASTTLHAVADLTNDPLATFDGTVYPLALVASPGPPSSAHAVRTQLGGPPHVPQRSLAGGGPWVLAGDPATRALAELARHETVGDRLRLRLGVKTGANHVFLGTAPPVEPELIRWAIRGRDLRSFRATPRIRIIWPCDHRGRALDILPPLARQYFAAHRDTLLARNDHASGPPWTLFRTAAALGPRVVWTDLARRLTAAALPGQRRTREARRRHHLIPLNTCYVAQTQDRATARRTAAWLNSTWMRAAARLQALPAAGGFFRFTAGVVAALPMPPTALESPQLEKLARAGAAGEEVQDTLDALVAELLDLSPAAQRALHAVDRARPRHRS